MDGNSPTDLGMAYRNLLGWIFTSFWFTPLQFRKLNTKHRLTLVLSSLISYNTMLMTMILRMYCLNYCNCNSFSQDGLDPRNVEFWSGGLNLFTARHACNMQRLVSLDPDNFARHLIYHSANNKQRQLFGRKQSFVKINDLYGQLLTVSKDAQDAMEKSNGQ